MKNPQRAPEPGEGAIHEPQFVCVDGGKGLTFKFEDGLMAEVTAPESVMILPLTEGHYLLSTGNT